MKRAIAHLTSLSDSELFTEVSAGIKNVIRSASILDFAARKLSKDKSEYPARILGNLAEEEAAKVLILLDAIRCPPQSGEDRSRTLGYFYDHLAKGIYAEVCKWSVLTFAELTKGVQREREPCYLDGPNDVDWIFPNRIVQRREDDLYVNYVQSSIEDGGSGEHYWTRPSRDVSLSIVRYHKFPHVLLDVAKALHEAGVTSPGGLATVAEIWRPVHMTPEFRIDELRAVNRATLERMDAQGLLRKSADAIYRTVFRDWPFPLYTVDLRMVPKKERDALRKALRQIQQNWTPYGEGGYYDEY